MIRLIVHIAGSLWNPRMKSGAGVSCYDGTSTRCSWESNNLRRAFSFQEHLLVLVRVDALL